LLNKFLKMFPLPRLNGGKRSEPTFPGEGLEVGVIFNHQFSIINFFRIFLTSTTFSISISLTLISFAPGKPEI